MNVEAILSLMSNTYKSKVDPRPESTGDENNPARLDHVILAHTPRSISYRKLKSRLIRLRFEGVWWVFIGFYFYCNLNKRQKPIGYFEMFYAKAIRRFLN